MLEDLKNILNEWNKSLEYHREQYRNDEWALWVKEGHLGKRNTYAKCIKDLQKIIDEHEGTHRSLR